MADVESRGGDESTPLIAGKSANRGGSASASTRDAHLDNCKFWLMCAVVFNHAFQDFFKSVLDKEAGGRPWCQPDVAPDRFGVYALARGTYMYLNLLGMPAFTLVSGICSRGLLRCATDDDGAGLAARSRRMVESLVVPYVVWQTFFLIYGTYGSKEFEPAPAHPVPFVSPVGVTWYLTALFAWRCSLQFIAKLRNVVAVTFAAGLAVGFVDTPRTENGGLPFLDYQRAVAFAPIFYVGATVLTEDVMRRLTDDGDGGASAGWVKIKRAFAWAATAATPALFAIAFAFGGGSDVESRGILPGICFDEAQRWAWTMDPYVGGVDAAAGGGRGDVERVVGVAVLLRLAFYACSVSLAVAFFVIVPRRERWYTARGSRTMYAYLLHLLVIRSYELVRDGCGLRERMPLWASAAVSLAALPSLTSVGLMSARCKAWTRWAVEPDFGRWLFPDDHA
ncbi:predicted protein [Micromonas commoda]|jgi:fucose 4-O-acetylase-like acetyltransferase|uniref:Acyltransferase 3 domain-containing protein n=1 Tax=Micromonas commoda (strain RCC299 / NOUM17 / CCMP2709) TaxID=296587 RepID=C1E600_MICCC|nr:predicted protein [Micromonas commoda]ACO63724.1 predicted protein [Micromonas commoda]|eukprot:XP_002502466.1 predicted protein [Micromonas commoda]